ncbi:MAG: DinB family protein [Phycisphaeraceae bacterium]|nr:DinB family protein [Phycisphaeraceae bacterium]MCB9848041.1 DinB family protein [Phycisphaeraceae bacterium]
MPLPYPWLERAFDFTTPIGMFPDLIERLRGVPARIEDHARGLPRDTLIRRDGDTWSIQENIGHLLDLESLPAQRLDDFLAGAPTLSAWAGNNDATWRANHNDRDIADLCARFRAARTALVHRLDALDEPDFARIAVHPRLNKPMRLLDLVEFTAQHDDYHLTRIAQLRRLFT